MSHKDVLCNASSTVLQLGLTSTLRKTQLDSDFKVKHILDFESDNSYVLSTFENIVECG